MPGFRVRDHRKWRRGPPRAAAPPGKPAPVAAPRPSLRPVAVPTPVAKEIQALDARIRSLGAVGWPARVHDTLFGRLHHRNATRITFQAGVVIVAMLLLVGGVSGESPLIQKTGDYRNITPATPVDAYITEGSITQYPIQVTESRTGNTRAVFDAARGDVRVPIAPEDAAYALQVRIVRMDPEIRPVLLIAEPGQDLRSVSPIADDSVTMSFRPIRLADAGKWLVVVHSSNGIGDVDIHLSIAKAPIEHLRVPYFDWMQTTTGLGLVALMIGAYTPGAVLLRQRRALRDRQEDEAWQKQSTTAPAVGTAGFARMQIGRSGVLAWQKPGKDVPERLASLPGKGWIIRLD